MDLEVLQYSFFFISSTNHEPHPFSKGGVLSINKIGPITPHLTYYESGGT